MDHWQLFVTLLFGASENDQLSNTISIFLWTKDNRDVSRNCGDGNAHHNNPVCYCWLTITP